MIKNTHFVVEHRLISIGLSNRGEIGGFDCQKIFDDLQGAKAFCQEYDIRPDMFAKSGYKDEAELVFLYVPRIYRKVFRGDKDSFERAKKGGYFDISKWVHQEGDTYEIAYAYFDTKLRVMSYSRNKTNSLQEALKIAKIRDTKRFLASDFALYSVAKIQP